jgi:SAM-dependent methyltransferase
VSIVGRPLSVSDAYDTLAPCYDLFTAHHDYELWVSGLLGLPEASGFTGKRALDAGCGTGKSLIPLLERGFSVVGCDLSVGMLELAEAKVDAAVELLQLDLRELPAIGEFDLITCLDDVFNYLTTPNDLTRALAGFARNLRPGGLVIFDANTVATYRGFFGETSVVEDNDTLLAWRGFAAPSFAEAELASGQIDIFTLRDGCWTHSISRHEQRHHPQATIRRAIRSAGLRCLAVYGQDPAVRFEGQVDELRHSKSIFLVTLDARSERR